MSLGPGATLGSFQIQSLLGKGGMGEVFSALDTRLDRKVAVKILTSDFATDSDRLRRFQSEAKTLASISHPNILVIHEVGTENRHPYLVSELLEGRTLREELAHGALPIRKATDYAPPLDRRSGRRLEPELFARRQAPHLECQPHRQFRNLYRQRRSKIGPFDSENSVEPFGFSPDSQSFTIAPWEQFFSIMITEGLSSGAS